MSEQEVQEIVEGLRDWWENSASKAIEGEAEEVRNLETDDEEQREMIAEQLEHIASDYDDEIEEVILQIVS